MTNQSVRKVAYVGLGSAGYPLASTLARHGTYELVVQDADPQRAKEFVREHSNATAATSPQDFSDVDVVVTMLPNGQIVREVLFGGDGSQGIAKSLKDGAVIIDTSSSSPQHTRETGKLLQDLNSTLALVDSPVTQEYAFALAKGDATFMVGCSNDEALEKAMPILKVMGKYIFVMGDLGAGHVTKTLNNYTSAGSILALCDALIAGQQCGLDPAKMIDVMNVGTGVNFSTKEGFRTDALTRRFKSGYQLALLVKDMRIAKEVIESTGLQSPLADLIVELLSDASEVAGEGADHTSCILGWEKKAGIQLKQSHSSGAGVENGAISKEDNDPLVLEIDKLLDHHEYSKNAIRMAIATLERRL
ncbi:2-hydroxy-3-oxopropionate reductase [Rhizodiscina lignyota]|uniref:3-hydroxyisobutyrate dehydrogenase n=1 Tax=Rhizodiscina lignyota TaxID=1504668 RepID=A0A9P4IJN7_9PEZI|nr:2-hydroxy-3-oxopropionate reductase [Rhizodiscina lignyota]